MEKERAAPDAAEGKSSERPFAVAAPQISLPKGGGAIRGIGEKFAANPVTGTGSLSVPIALSPGRSGFGPQLALGYDSGAGNGPFGLGWSLSLALVSRRTDKGLPRYVDNAESDIFVLSGAEDLVPVLVEDSGGGWRRDPVARGDYTVWRYRPRVEGLFSRIERWTRSSDGDTYWRSISRDNVTTFYGKTPQSRIADPVDPSRVFTWLICESRDDKGNAAVYEYVAEDSAGVDLAQVNERNRDTLSRSANRYLKRIKYGNTVSALVQPDLSQQSWLFEAVLDYGEGHLTSLAADAEGREFASASLIATQPWPVRQDPFSRYRACYEVRSYRLCRRVLMFHHFAAELGAVDTLVRATEFAYDEGPVASFITAVTQSGFVRQADGRYLKRSLPPLEFEYSQAQVQSTVQEVDPASLANLPANPDGALYQWLDLDGEGLQGLLASYEGSWYYKRNLSPLTLDDAGGEPIITARFDSLVEVAKLPGFGWAHDAHHQFMDLAADGRHDCVVLERPQSGFYKRTGDEDWEPFMALQSVPNVDWKDPNLRFVDLDGDGRADVLVTEHEVFTWYPSLGETGFDAALRVTQPRDEEQGPAVVFADGTQTLFLADMSGDGLTDLVRIRNGAVCYWPNTGYGQFGAKVEMDNAPWFEAQDLFDPRRVRLADIDGSGTVDIIYLASDGVRLHFNQGGNSFSEPQLLPAFPPLDSLAAVQAMDLLGNGTACLVWMSNLPNDARRSMRFVDLMGGCKPYLLLSTRNNLGAETHIRYAPSTKFYLSDRQSGTPWMTRLPFPVQVVERVEIYDTISRNRFVSRYAYHHGYYDGVEREFRGFGMVEQWDTEEIGALSQGGSFPDSTNIDAASYVPPMLSRTWFHLGTCPHGSGISRLYQQEYYREPGLSDAGLAAMQLPDTVLPADIAVEEVREAIRSLKGSMLRQETYSLDGSAAASRPYSVAEQNLTIRKLQPFGPNRHAVFFTHARESIGLHYERKLYDVGGGQLADPRTTHNMVLAIDDYGNVLQTAAIAYGRRYDDPDPLLTAPDRACQARIMITAGESSYTNPILEDDAYRPPLPAGILSYELIKLTPDSAVPGITNLFRFDELAAKLAQAGDGSHDLPYEDIDAAGATEAHPYRRLIAQARTLYRKDDLSACLPLGQAESLALSYEGYKLAFTPGLLALFQRNGQNLLNDPGTVLGTQGGYVPGDSLQHAGLFPAGDAEGLWWVPSGRIFYSPAATDTATAELALAQGHFFRPRRVEDAFGNPATVLYDGYDLLVLETQDALQNRITTGARNAGGSIVNGNDYRVLQPALLTDANGNRSQVIFDTLGLVAGTAVMGKVTETLGDSLTGFEPDLSQAQIDAFIADPRGPGTALLLGNASTRIVYDLSRYQSPPAASGAANPSFAAAIARETHVSDLAVGQVSKLQVSLGFSDGFGREIQKKIQADPGPLAPGGPAVAARWVTSGWTVFNNKGKPVRKYEPFFDDSADFKFGLAVGVSPILFYDPAQRVVATLHPDHSWNKVTFDPWRQETWDGNDTVLIADPTADPDLGPFAQRLPAADYLPTWYAARIGGAIGPDAQDTAQKAAAHAGTPLTVYFDTLGRNSLSLAWNRNPSTGAPVDDHLRSLIAYDIAGKEIAVTDALNRVVMTYAYDMTGQQISQFSMEAGARRMLKDVVGKPLLSWDSRGHCFTTIYDVLHRPLQQLVRGSTADSDPRTLNRDVLIHKIEYGEGVGNAASLNLLARVYRSFDPAGVAINASLDTGNMPIQAYDFKGNPLSITRQLAVDYKAIADWSANPQLSDETFEGSTRYDALNRAIQFIAPHSSLTGQQHPNKFNVIQSIFNAAGLLQEMDVWLEQTTEPAGLIDPGKTAPSGGGVANIDYDAKGQRLRIDYDNGAGTSYTYDPLTYRLTQLLTRRNAAAFPSDDPQPLVAGWPGRLVQNLSYAYDPVGNVTYVRDDAQQTIYFKNKRVEPSNDYTYDALYRLIQATGREHLGQSGAPLAPSYDDAGPVGLLSVDVAGRFAPGDGNAMGTYIESYVYDAVGNFQQMQHRGSDPAQPGWTRSYDYLEPSLIEDGGGTPLQTGNRLTRTTLNPSGSMPQPEAYSYDPHGNTVRMPHLGGALPGPNTYWDYKDQLRQVDLGGGGAAFYAYDAAGQRARKVWEKAPGLVEERIYLGSFEVYRRHGGPIGENTATLEREALHVRDDKQRIVLVETRTLDISGSDPAPRQMIRYQLGNHLGSVSLELDVQAQIISYEEYAPYGNSTYQAVRSSTEVPKRYRHTGKERDEESGLYYYGVRYYAAFLGRWISADPTDIHGGIDLYAYARCNPISNRDSDGRVPDSFAAGKAWEAEILGKLEEMMPLVQQVTVVAEINGKKVVSVLDGLGKTADGWVVIESKLSSPILREGQELIMKHLQAGGSVSVVASTPEKIAQLQAKLGISAESQIATKAYDIVTRGNAAQMLSKYKAIPKDAGVLLHESGKLEYLSLDQRRAFMKLQRENPGKTAEELMGKLRKAEEEAAAAALKGESKAAKGVVVAGAELAGKEARIARVIAGAAGKVAIGVGVGLSAWSAYENFKGGDYVGAVLDVGGMLPGPVGIGFTIIGVGYAIYKIKKSMDEEPAPKPAEPPVEPPPPPPHPSAPPVHHEAPAPEPPPQPRQVNTGPFLCS